MKKWICPKCGYIMEIDKLKLCLVCQTDCKNFIGIDESEEKFFNSKNIELDKEINKDMINDLKKIYNILNQMCLDEAKYGKSFETLSNEYFVAK